MRECVCARGIAYQIFRVRVVYQCQNRSASIVFQRRRQQQRQLTRPQARARWKTQKCCAREKIQQPTIRFVNAREEERLLGSCLPSLSSSIRTHSLMDAALAGGLLEGSCKLYAAMPLREGLRAACNAALPPADGKVAEAASDAMALPCKPQCSAQVAGRANVCDLIVAKQYSTARCGRCGAFSRLPTAPSLSRLRRGVHFLHATKEGNEVKGIDGARERGRWDGVRSNLCPCFY